MKYKIGDIIDYGFYKSIEIIDTDNKHYILQDKENNEKKVYIDLVDKYAVLSNWTNTLF